MTLKRENLYNIMPQEQTNKSRYPSKYSPHTFIAARQYIIELICERKAQKEDIILPLRFWKDDEWKKFYKSQLRRCDTLLKKYSDIAIIKALNTYRGKKIYSLFAAWLEDIIAEEQKKLNNIKRKPKKFSDRSKNIGRIPKKKTIEKIKELDD